MRPTNSTGGRVLPALLAAAVVSVVFGIVGMHALDTHGVMGNPEHAAMTGQTTGQTSGSHGDMSADMGASDLAGVTGAGAAAPAGNSGHTMGGMVMSCVAVLAAAAGVLLLLLIGLRRIPRVWAHLPTVPGTLPRWFTARIGTGPSPVWDFSVIRC